MQMVLVHVDETGACCLSARVGQRVREYARELACIRHVVIMYSYFVFPLDADMYISIVYTKVG